MSLSSVSSSSLSSSSLSSSSVSSSSLTVVWSWSLSLSDLDEHVKIISKKSQKQTKKLVSCLSSCSALIINRENFSNLSALHIHSGATMRWCHFRGNILSNQGSLFYQTFINTHFRLLILEKVGWLRLGNSMENYDYVKIIVCAKKSTKFLLGKNEI